MKRKKDRILTDFLIFVLITGGICFLLSGFIFVSAVTRQRLEATEPETVSFGNIIN